MMEYIIIYAILHDPIYLVRVIMECNLQIYKDEIDILGYIDNNPEKNGQIINGFPCLPLRDAKLSDGIGIIVTMSQIVRVQPVNEFVN